MKLTEKGLVERIKNSTSIKELLDNAEKISLAHNERSERALLMTEKERWEAYKKTIKKLASTLKKKDISDHNGNTISVDYYQNLGILGEKKGLARVFNIKGMLNVLAVENLNYARLLVGACIEKGVKLNQAEFSDNVRDEIYHLHRCISDKRAPTHYKISRGYEFDPRYFSDLMKLSEKKLKEYGRKNVMGMLSAADSFVPEGSTLFDVTKKNFSSGNYEFNNMGMPGREFLSYCQDAGFYANGFFVFFEKGAVKKLYEKLYKEENITKETIAQKKEQYAAKINDIERNINGFLKSKAENASDAFWQGVKVNKGTIVLVASNGEKQAGANSNFVKTIEKYIGKSYDLKLSKDGSIISFYKGGELAVFLMAIKIDRTNLPEPSER